VRFVILHHTGAGADHYDLMVESGGALRTWGIGSPDLRDQTAEQKPDHRLAYLDFEGPVSGGRGEVRRVEGGTCEVRVPSEKEILLDLSGGEFKGSIRLCLETTDPGPGARWSLTREDPGPSMPPRRGRSSP
jgi:hypothetical protein